MGTTFSVVDVTGFSRRVVGLMQAHWQEAGAAFPFRPDFTVYGALQEAGALFCVGVERDGEAIGYCTVTLSGHPHNPDVRVAASDALYVAPAHRGWVSARLIRFTEDEARKRGAVRMLWHTSARTDLASMLERHGYAPVDVVVMRSL